MTEKNEEENNNIQCCFCGPIRQCAEFLPAVLNNIEKIGSKIFLNNFAVIVYYDKSTDNSLSILQQWKKQHPTIDMHICTNTNTNDDSLSMYRTHRISAARNKCLKMVSEKYQKCPYIAMMDFDHPNSKMCCVKKLHKYFNPDKLLNKWDALSFQTAPHYYDIWALSIAPFCFSYNHFPNNERFHVIIQQYMDRKLAATDRLIPCISAFNGFAFYKTSKFAECYYCGDILTSIRLSNKISFNWIKQHKLATNSTRLLFKDYGHVKGNAEDCEHRPFHMQAIYKHGAKIRISPEIIFK